MQKSSAVSDRGSNIFGRDRRVPPFKKENAGCRSYESSSGILVNVQQRLNCALSVVSLSSGFFRFQSLHGVSVSDQLIHSTGLAVDPCFCAPIRHPKTRVPKKRRSLSP